MTEEGKGMVEHGSHEAVVWGLVGEGGMPQPDLFTAAGTFGLPQYFFSRIFQALLEKLASARQCQLGG